MRWFVISWVTELIDKIPDILSYIIYGYVYLTAYYWISFKDNKDFKKLIIKSVAVSYILLTFYDAFAFKYNIVFTNHFRHTIYYFIISAILGLIIGKVISHRNFNLLLHRLNVGRTTNENIWDDVIKPYTWLRIYMKDGSSYLGQYKYGEPFVREPIIMLVTYQKFDNENDIVIDYSQDPNRAILLNTKGFEKIEVVYVDSQKNNCNKNSEHINKNKTGNSK